jgi:hypothetical protein
MLKFAQKVPIIIMSMVIAVVTIMSNQAIATEVTNLPDRLIGESDKVWTLNLPKAVDESIVKTAIKMTTTDGIEKAIDIESIEGTTNFQISPQEAYDATQIYTLSVGKAVFESYASPREELKVTFKQVDMDVQIGEGLTIFQKLVTVKLPESYSGSYDITVSGKKMTYKEEKKVYLGLVDLTDEEAIKNSIIVTKQVDERQANS